MHNKLLFRVPIEYSNRLIGLGVSVLTTDLEVAASIPGNFTILNVDKVWNEVHSATYEQLRSYLIERPTWLKKVNKHNANHIIPSGSQLQKSS